MMSSAKAWLKPHLVRFVSRHLDLGFKPCRDITHQEIRVRYKGSDLVFSADFRTPLYETVNEVLTYDCYQLAEIPFSHLGNALVIDIGANIGVSSVALAHLTGGRVHAFEPVTANFLQLQANLRANSIENVDCRKSAVSEDAGTATMAINPDQSVSPYIAGQNQPPIPRGFQTEEVEVVALRSLLRESDGQEVDLIKMDCEGAEYGLIENLASLDHTLVRAITMEVHDLDRDRNCRTMRTALEKLGYQVQYKPELLGRPVLHHLLAVRR